MRTILLALLSGSFLFANAQNKEGEYHLDKEYKISPSGVIDLSSSDAKVSITGSQRKTAHVKIDRIVSTKGVTFGSYDEFSVEITESNGDLEIRERSSSVSVAMIGYHFEKYTIAIEAPEGASLKVKGDDGNYIITNIDGAISLTLDDADVDLRQCSGDKFRFRIDDGDIDMDQATGSLELDGDDSDITIKNSTLSFIDANVDDGDFVIETALSPTGEYRITGQDGLISLTVTKGGGRFSIRHDDGRITTEGNFNKEEESENYTRLVLADGKAKIDIRTDDARVKLAQR